MVSLQSDIEVEDTSNEYGYWITSVKQPLVLFMSLSVLNTTLVVQPNIALLHNRDPNAIGEQKWS